MWLSARLVVLNDWGQGWCGAENKNWRFSTRAFDCSSKNTAGIKMENGKAPFKGRMVTESTLYCIAIVIVSCLEWNKHCT